VNWKSQRGNWYQAALITEEAGSGQHELGFEQRRISPARPGNGYSSLAAWILSGRALIVRRRRAYGPSSLLFDSRVRDGLTCGDVKIQLSGPG
jgi:hypothetical protein